MGMGWVSVLVFSTGEACACLPGGGGAGKTGERAAEEWGAREGPPPEDAGSGLGPGSEPGRPASPRARLGRELGLGMESAVLWITFSQPQRSAQQPRPAPHSPGGSQCVWQAWRASQGVELCGIRTVGRVPDVFEIPGGRGPHAQ